MHDTVFGFQSCTTGCALSCSDSKPKHVSLPRAHVDVREHARLQQARIDGQEQGRLSLLYAAAFLAFYCFVIVLF